MPDNDNYLSEVMSRGIPFKKVSKSNITILCPFHDDHHPSLSLNIQKGIFRCFSCHESGYFYRLIAVWDGVTESEAKEKWQESGLIQTAYGDIESFFTVNAPSTRYFDFNSFTQLFDPVASHKEGLQYLSKRNITARDAGRFLLRWGIKGRYKDRVIIPIVDVNKKIASYAARSIFDDVYPKTRKPKSATFTLFGLANLIVKDIDLPWVICVEGEFDAMYLQHFGIPAVATMGTSGLTDKQLSLLVKYTKRVVLSYDGDEAGRKAMFGYKTTKGLTVPGDRDKIQPYLPVETVILPDGKDPNDLSFRQVEKFYGQYVM